MVCLRGMFMLKSLKDNGIYVEMSREPEKRLRLHNKGKTVSTRIIPGSSMVEWVAVRSLNLILERR